MEWWQWVGFYNICPYTHVLKKTLVSDLIPVWVVTLIFILVLVGYLYSYPQSPQTFFFPSHDCTPHTMHSLWDNKTFPLSFIRILPLFHSIFYFHGNKTFLSTSQSWFSYLMDLLSCYKLGKMLTSFESPYMVCTCCIIWLEVQVVGYRHIRMLSLSVTLLKWSSFWILEQMQHFFPTKFWKILLKICWTYNCILESIF